MNKKTAVLFLLILLVLPLGTLAASRTRGMTSAMRRAINNLDDDKEKNFPVPILLDMTPAQVRDTWGEARSQGRTHEGTDIFAPRNALVVSPTEAVVTSIVKEDDDNRNTLGGNYVYTQNPGGERFYYAHLDHFANDLKVGTVLKPGDLIGYVGNSGNASGGVTHLHFGIYDKSATNPYPRLTEEFSLKDKMKALDRMLDNEDDDDREEVAKALLASHRPLFTQAASEDIDLPEAIEDVMTEGLTTWKMQIPSRDLSLGMQGDDVAWLQQFLMSQNSGQAAQALYSTGATGYFGAYTKNAMVEYQNARGIIPVSGIFGPDTKTYLASH